MKEFNSTKWRQFVIAEGNFGNDPQDRYNYARKFTADLPDTARSEYLVSNLEDALEDYKLTDEVGEFDQAFVDIMKALGKEKELSEDLFSPNEMSAMAIEKEMAEGKGIPDVNTDFSVGTDFSDDLSENDEALDEVINEGTWSYGSENDMMKALEEMNAMLMHSDPRQLKAGLDAMDNALYRIFGDDDFHDSLGVAQDFAAEGDLDRAKNALSDAMGIGDRMIAKIHGMDGYLDEVINEAKPNLKKALPTIAARNVERNNNINFDIESMMDMVGEAGKGEDSKEAKILFRASNASSDLEQALVDLQAYFEDNLDEAKEEIDEVKDAKFEIGDKVTMKAGGGEMEIVGARKMFGNNTQAYKVKKADGETVEYSANQLKKA